MFNLVNNLFEFFRIFIVKICYKEVIIYFFDFYIIRKKKLKFFFMDFFFKKYFYKCYVIGFDFGYIFLVYGYDILL